MISAAVGCFGKLPFHGDFIRLQEGRCPVEALAAWFHAGNLDVERQPQRVAAFDGSGPAFAIVPAAGWWWALALFPSRDQVGRRYPFVLCTGLPSSEVADEIGLLPALFSQFFQAAYQAAGQGWPSDVQGLRALLAGLSGTLDPAREAQILANALAAVDARQLWTGFLGGFADPRKAPVVARALDLATGARADWGLRIAPTVHQTHVSFWLWLLSLVRSQRTPPGLIAMHPASAARPPSTILLWDGPSPESHFAALWPACSIPDFDARIHDLLASADQGVAIDELEDVLGDPDLAVSDLLHELVTLGRAYALRSRRFTRSRP